MKITIEGALDFDSDEIKYQVEHAIEQAIRNAVLVAMREQIGGAFLRHQKLVDDTIAAGLTDEFIEALQQEIRDGSTR